MRRRLGRPVPLAAIFVVLTVFAVYLAFTKRIPFVHHFTVQGVFRTANNIQPNSFVRIAGVNVGKVKSITPLAKGGEGSLVTMEMQDTAQPLHTDATMKIRPRIFLEGNFFVDMTPGTPEAPVLKDGGRIPMSQTAAPVQLDQVLGVFHQNDRQNLVTLLANYATGLQGPGVQGFNRSIQYWTAAYRDGAVVNQAFLGVQPHDLSGYIRSMGQVAAALDRNPEQLKSLIVDFNTTAAALAREQGNLEAAVGELPRTLRVGQPALAALDGSFPAVRRLTADLRPTVRSTGPTIDATLPLLAQLNGLVSRPELRGLVADLRPTIPALARLNAATVPLLQQVRLASSCQNQVILPWSHDTLRDPNFPATGKVYQEGVKFLPGVAGESRSGDANGQYFNVLASGGANAISFGNGLVGSSVFPIQGSNPPKPSTRPPIRPDVPCETQQRPNLSTTVGPAPQQAMAPLTSPLGLQLMARDAKKAAQIKRELAKGQPVQGAIGK